MSLSDEHRRLADFIDALESDGVDVTFASLVDGRTDERAVSAELRIELPVDGDGPSSPLGADTARGRERESPGNGTGPTPDEEEPTSNTGGTGRAGRGDRSDPVVADAGTGGTDGEIVCSHEGCEETFDSEHGMKIHRTKVHGSGGREDEGPGPVHQDPEALAEVYDRYDTFEEMRDALDVDVSAQTVRRQMISHGIHDPESRRTPEAFDDVIHAANGSAAADDDGGTEARSTDGGTDRRVAAVGGGAGDPPSNDRGTADTLEKVARRVREMSDDGSTTNGDGPSTGDGTDGSPSGPDDATGGPGASNGEVSNGGTSDGEESAETGGPQDEAGGGSDRGGGPLPEYEHPNGVTVDTLRTAVEGANTVYQVKSHLDLGYDETVEVLSEFDLLELVSGRASTLGTREQRKAEIDERIRENVPDG